MKNTEEAEDKWRQLELGLGSGTKFRVIKSLILDPDRAFTKYALVKATGLKTRMVEDQLKVLARIGWIKCYPFTPKTYQANLENQTVTYLRQLFSRIRTIR